MRILVVNDDGIAAEGIRRLAQAAATLGEAWVVAPADQCSAMSHRITVQGQFEVRTKQFPVEGVRAYSVSGTPADCVKTALRCLMPGKPDVVLSGVNCGYNAGLDLLYSGTVGAAMEALSNGIPAIAFSSGMNGMYDVVDEYLLPVMRELLDKPLQANELWNVNFPGCARSELKGILRERIPDQTQFYLDHYDVEELEDGILRLTAGGIPIREGKEGTDIAAVLANYISIGTVRNAILAAEPRGQED